MSNDYALFIIQLPNDFEDENFFVPNPSNALKSLVVAPLINPLPARMPSASTRTSILPSISSIIEKGNRHSTKRSTESLCTLLTNYLAKKTTIEAVWMATDDKKTYQVTFYVEFGIVSDRIVQDLIKLGIGRSNNTKVFVLPTTLIVEGRNNNKKQQSISTLSLSEDSINNELLSMNSDNKINDINLTSKIRKRFSESNFKKSIRARLMVHQVVASIRAATTLSFDFILLICLASMLAAFGLLENSTVIIVASMLVSPLMNPILGIVFGLSVREHSLWKRGLRNELIGLIICMSCGFIIGLFTTFSETKWGSSTSFPTTEMKSRGDVKRLWVGVLIALPSGAGVALSVLGGNTGSLVGVAISASLLPPAVNCGLLFAYSLLGVIFSNVADVSTLSSNSTNLKYSTILNCSFKYINNDYEPLYRCHLEKEAAILGSCSLLLTIVNIICIIIMALFILRIKEVIPLHQPNKDISHFFHYDVKVARDYNKTMSEGDLESDDLPTSTIHRSHLAQSIVRRWKRIKTLTAHDNLQQQQEIERPTVMHSDIELAHNEIHNNTLNIDMESRRKLLRLKTFATEYNLDVFDKCDYDLLTSDSRDKVHALVNDLLDVCQEQVSTVLVELCHLQPGGSQTSSDREQRSFCEEIIELLPPKWYQLIVHEQKRRQTATNPSSVKQRYSANTPKSITIKKSMTESNENNPNQSEKIQYNKNNAYSHRRSSVPVVAFHSLNNDQESKEIPLNAVSPSAMT